MPAGETTEEHSIAKEEEASIVERDKSNNDPRTGGLFRGCFRGRSMGFHAIIRDDEDGVERCPRCAWELEDGYCNSCRARYGSELESYYGDSIPSEFDHSETENTVSDDGFHDHDFHIHHDPLNEWNGTEPLEVGDDISLDGDGQAVHALDPYGGHFAFERRAAEILSRPIRRNGSPSTAHIPRHYAPSMLSEVTTTYSEGDAFSDMAGEDSVDGGEDFDEDDEEDDVDEDDSLSGFIVQDGDGEIHTLECHLNRTRATSEDTDVQEQTCPFEHFQQEHSNEQYRIDDSAEDSDSRPHPGNGESHPANQSPSISSISSSEDGAPVPLQYSRKRRRVVHQITSDEESDSEEDSVRSRPRRRVSSSGSATVGRQSPVLGSSRAIPNRPMPRRRAAAEPDGVEADPSDSDSDVQSVLPANHRPSRRRRTNNQRPPRRAHNSRDNENFANLHSSRTQNEESETPSTTRYDSSNFSRIQPDLAPPPLAIRRDGPSARRRQEASERRRRERDRYTYA